jgi:hypothetical protein
MSLHQRETIKVPLLFCAWEHGHMAMVELLLDYGASVAQFIICDQRRYHFWAMHSAAEGPWGGGGRSVGQVGMVRTEVWTVQEVFRRSGNRLRTVQCMYF